MKEESETLNNTNDSCLNPLPAPHSSLDTLQEPFLYFHPNSELSFEDKSSIYNSLVALVKAEYPFDDALQERAVRFLKSLEPEWNEQLATKLVTDLVPSSAGSTSGFVESILTLVSSPHSRVVGAALSFLFKTTLRISPSIQSRLVESDLISNVLASVQPHSLPIAENETMMNNLIKVIANFTYPASPLSLRKLGITTAVDQLNIREMIFQKVVLPSSHFVSFLISNRYLLNGGLFRSFMSLLDRFIDIGPFHRPALEFVLASPIAMAFSSCLSFVEDDERLWITLNNSSLKDGSQKDQKWSNQENGCCTL